MLHNELERLLIATQLIKIHEQSLSVDQTPLIKSYQTFKTNHDTHIEYSIALVETHDEQAINVIFPGSNDWEDWKANFRFSLRAMIYKATQQVTDFVASALDIPLAQAYEDISLVVPHADKEGSEEWSDQRVHAGFMRSYHRIEDRAIDDLNDVLTRYPTLNVYGTAHSLGSAILRFMLLDAQFKGLFKDRNLPILSTFGAPRMGNNAFCKALHERLPHITRVVHANDLVTRLPLPLIGYRHEIEQKLIGRKRFFRWYYKKDITDHFLESYMDTLTELIP